MKKLLFIIFLMVFSFAITANAKKPKVVWPKAVLTLKDGIEAVKKLFASDPDGDMDHKSLAKQDKKHTGVSNYNQVKREMIKKYPSTKKVFDSEQKKYEKEFGN